ncbi:pyridoxal-phosphate dependent enzyme [Candidatus Gottesmanbacteria bacterium]|nr:pyridoxal-phosphate dependent enzyme [Candidatus Gottesmanbacteria bacterium]
MYYKSILDLIGNTPLVRINKLNPNPSNVTILVKLEYLNPGGSIKDRMVKEIVAEAEKNGELKKGGTIVEATSGNTGIGFAMVSAVKGYKAIFTQPNWMSANKRKLIEAFGAKVHVCPTAVPIDDPRSYKSTAKRIAKEKGAYLSDQYSNPANPVAHYKTTGREIWEALNGKIDYIVIGIGTGGTSTGVVKFLKEKNPKIKFIAPDPIGSVYSGKLGAFRVEGIGHIFIPKNVDLSLVDEFVRLESKKAIEMAKRITCKEGILAGPSSGAAMYAAVEVAKKIKEKGKVIVAIFPDSGERYLDYLYDEDFEVPVVSKHRTKENFSTSAIHGPVSDFQDRNALVPPLYRSAIYKFKNVEEAGKIFEGSNRAEENRSKYVYTRGNHPNQRLLERTLTRLEGGVDSVAFSSGMAAITSFAETILHQGDEVVASNVLYGDTHKFFNSFVKRWGIKTTFVDITNLSQVQKAISKKTKLIYTETPTNPLLTIADIEKLSQIAKQANAILVIDNTFASPYLQQPLKLGADVVIESTTKYISGHSDALGGIVIAKNQDLIMELWGTLFVKGAQMDPEVAALSLRGLKTLGLRMERHCQNAQIVAKFLSKHPKVKVVYYPGLITHPQHDLARVQMNGFGGIVSFELKGGIEEGKKFVNNLKLFSLSVSLGAIESLVNHPASMTQKVIPQKERLKAGITDGLIRLSVGIEDVDDLLADLRESFNTL